MDALWNELKDKARISCGIEDFEYGMREFAIHYMLQFGQETRELDNE
jgi:hypothetical protein